MFSPPIPHHLSMHSTLYSLLLKKSKAHTHTKKKNTSETQTRERPIRQREDKAKRDKKTTKVLFSSFWVGQLLQDIVPALRNG